jgi:hypothetical protein
MAAARLGAAVGMPQKCGALPPNPARVRGKGLGRGNTAIGATAQDP